jgi:hypothetical protein
MFRTLQRYGPSHSWPVEVGVPTGKSTAKSSLEIPHEPVKNSPRVRITNTVRSVPAEVKDCHLQTQLQPQLQLHRIEQSSCSTHAGMIVKGAIIRHSKIFPHCPLRAEEALTVARDSNISIYLNTTIQSTYVAKFVIPYTVLSSISHPSRLIVQDSVRPS